MTIRPWRRGVQAAMLALLAAIPLLNRGGHSFLSGSLYSMAIGPLWLTDPAIGLQTMLTAWSADPLLLLSLLPPLLLALVGGRFFCGWLCPQNAISELVEFGARRFGWRRRFSPPNSARPRYLVLAGVLLAMAAGGWPLMSLFSPPGILSVQLAKFVQEQRWGAELALVGVIILFELFLLSRAWCNFLCPVGSVLGIFRVRRTLKVVFTESGGRSCSHCQACARACQLGLDPVAGPLYPQCHNCGDCLDACPMAPERKPLLFRW